MQTPLQPAVPGFTGLAEWPSSKEECCVMRSKAVYPRSENQRGQTGAERCAVPFRFASSRARRLLLALV
jgi:hypothetical protein